MNTTFVPDDTTAAIADADFTVTSGAVANNTDTNTLTAIVKDANGNAVSGITVTFDVTTGAATPASQTATTDASGVATATSVSLVAGDNQVTAKVNSNTTAAKATSFIPDGGTAAIADADFTVTSGAVANNTDTNTLTAIVKDSNGNVVSKY
ncbi:Ig-like domain-containing protein [Mangrovibacter sp. SLW1]